MTSSKNIPHCHHGSQKLDKPRLTSTPQVRAAALLVGKSSKIYCLEDSQYTDQLLPTDAIQYVTKIPP